MSKPTSASEPAIWVRRTIGAKGLSRLGGLPSLPPNVEWPRHHISKAPLHFLAQIDLTRLPSTPLPGTSSRIVLPRSGMLFFFADIVEEMLWNDEEFDSPNAATRVLFAEHAGTSDRSAPDDLPEILHAYGETGGGYETNLFVYPQASVLTHQIETPVGTSFEDAPDIILIDSIEKAIGPLPHFKGNSPDTWKAIEEISGQEFIHDREYLGPQGPHVIRKLNCPMHQMLGIGKNIQGAADEARKAGLVLLLQLDSDLAIHEHFMFCDMGAAQFWIKPDDLVAGRFDQAWATTEGG